MRVYVVVGWFGELEWIEAIYASTDLASRASAELWATRDSARTPEHARRVAKFRVEAWPVLNALAPVEARA